MKKYTAQSNQPESIPTTAAAPWLLSQGESNAYPAYIVWMSI